VFFFFFLGITRYPIEVSLQYEAIVYG